MLHRELLIRLYVTMMILMPYGVWAGCSYDEENKEYTCGSHGVCKRVEINSLMVLRYCVCSKGYSGKETCDEVCKDCCQQMADQCYSRRVKTQCKVPKCLNKVLKNRKCPKDSPARKEMNKRIWSYLSICKKKKH